MKRRSAEPPPRSRRDELEAMLAAPGRVGLADLYGGAGDFADIDDPGWDAALAEWRAITGASRTQAEQTWPYPFAE